MLEAVLSLKFPLFIFGGVSLDHAVAANYGKFHGRETVAFCVKKQLPEKGNHVHEHIVIDWWQKFQKAPTPGLNALSIDFHRWKE